MARELPRVVNVRGGRQNFDVYIGRPSPWGNPFRVGRDGTRDEVVDKYREWLLSSPAGERLLRWLPFLEGKRLGCFCSPESCHGDVLVALFMERLT